MAKGQRQPPVTTKVGTLSHPHLLEPYAFPVRPGESPKPPRYGCVAIFGPEVDLTPLKKAAVAARDDFFGGSPPRGLRSPFRKCEEKWAEKDGKPILEPGYVAGGTFIAFDGGDRAKPDCRDQRMLEVTDASKLYPGCKCLFVVRAAGYDRMGNKGVKFYLLTLQKVGEGENIAGRVSAADYFKPVEEVPDNATTGATTGDGWEDGEDENF